MSKTDRNTALTPEDKLLLAIFHHGSDEELEALIAWINERFVQREAEVVALCLETIATVLPDDKGHLVSSHSVIRRELDTAIRASLVQT